MKTLALLLLVSPVTAKAIPSQPDPTTVKTLAKAIYIAEGADKASVPYGIMSQRVRSQDHARRICEASIRKNWARWREAGCPGDFIGFMAKRYCPVGANNDKGTNREWPDNVRKWYRKLAKEEA